jgi:hypothetical protein
LITGIDDGDGDDDDDDDDDDDNGSDRSRHTSVTTIVFDMICFLVVVIFPLIIYDAYSPQRSAGRGVGLPLLVIRARVRAREIDLASL